MYYHKPLFGLIASFLCLVSTFAAAAEGKAPPPSITPETLKLQLDTVWIITAGSLVFIMQAGFACLETGLVRAKNAVNVVMKNYTDMCFGAVAFWCVGFGLMFGTNGSGFLGTDHFFLGNTTEINYSFLFFQIMVASTSATIVSGALAERTRFEAYLVTCTLIAAFIYPIYGSWVWGGQLFEGAGWLKKLGFHDFSGGSVVHAVGGWCALAGIIVLGPRLGKYDQEGKPRYIPGHNLPLVALGGFLLWFGCIGFNAGMGMKADVSIGKLALNTHLAASAGVVGAVLTMVFKRKPIILVNTIYGGLGGLVSIAAGCDVVDPLFAMLIGIIAGTIVIHGVEFMDRKGWDDPVGAVAVHAFCGSWGVIAVALFNRGAMFNPKSLFIQLIGVITCFVWSFLTAYAMFKLIHRYVGLRASTVAQQRGLDYSEHYEIGYPEFQKDQLHQGKNSKI